MPVSDSASLANVGWFNMNRKYLPTLSDLIDRLSIVLMKAIFIGENREGYMGEVALLEHDINMELSRLHGDRDFNLSAYDLRMVMMIMLANRFIWENESLVRQGHHGAVERLHATHSVNGVRNTAKNKLAMVFGERKDLKVDCLAADLPPELGNWDVF